MEPKFIPGLLLSKEAKPYPRMRYGRSLGWSTPLRIDRRDELLPASDQGSTPMCAAYSMAGIAEWRNWKLLGDREQVDPVTIYNEAKLLDGAPNEDGTTLQAVLEAAQRLGTIPRVRRVKVIEDYAQMHGALHRHDVILTGLEIDEGWLRARPDGWISSGGNVLGGHAVVFCGYAQDNEEWVAFQTSWGDKVGWRGFVRMDPGLFAIQFRYALVWDW